MSKELVYDELKKILWGIKLKDIDTIIGEINQLKDKITSYREPYKCETCAVKNVNRMRMVIEIVVGGNKSRVR